MKNVILLNQDLKLNFLMITINEQHNFYFVLSAIFVKVPLSELYFIVTHTRVTYLHANKCVY